MLMFISKPGTVSHDMARSGSRTKKGSVVPTPARSTSLQCQTGRPIERLSTVRAARPASRVHRFVSAIRIDDDTLAQPSSEDMLSLFYYAGYRYDF
ncbi:MAG: hypothetical protein KA144_00650 [Xanthomonadaceae bacterium]|nr:hypothetical protein [Xanthomonadaceae bacterium]